MVAYSEEELQLRPIDVNTVEPNGSMLVIGGSKSGKTTKVFYLYRTAGKKMHKIVAQIGSSCSNYKFIPPLYQHLELDEKMIERQYRRQKRKTLMREVLKDNTPVPCLNVIVDDFGIRTKKSAIIDEVFTKGRHENMGITLIVQNVKHLSDDQISNADIIVLMAVNASDGQDYLRKKCTNCPKPLFSALMDRYTANKGALVIKKSSEGQSYRDLMFYLRIPDSEFKRDEDDKPYFPSNFVIGSEKYHRYNRVHYRNRLHEAIKEQAEREQREKHKLARQLCRKRGQAWHGSVYEDDTTSEEELPPDDWTAEYRQP